MPNTRPRKTLRIVLTGGPGGGKSTVANLFQKEYGRDTVLVPEAASIAFSIGFPRASKAQLRKYCQRAIYHLQKNIEDVQAHLSRKRILLCDRGTLDGIAYWPQGPKSFLQDVGSTLQSEFVRYDAVCFLETAAVGGHCIRGGNPFRRESVAQAISLDRKLRRIWSCHPNFIFIRHERMFQKKIDCALQALIRIATR